MIAVIHSKFLAKINGFSFSDKEEFLATNKTISKIEEVLNMSIYSKEAVAYLLSKLYEEAFFLNKKICDMEIINKVANSSFYQMEVKKIENALLSKIFVFLKKEVF